MAKSVVRSRAAGGRVWPLPQLCARATKELFPGTCRAARPVTILALSHARFMDDLSALARTGEVRIFGFPLYWQFAPPSWYPGDYLALDRDRQQFLEAFLREYLRLIGVDCVVSTAIWYTQDIPWGMAAEAVGVPYVVFHKESYKTTESQLASTAQRAAVVGPFRGSHLVVHNEPIKEVLTRSGFVEPDRISVFGSMRMDDLVARADMQLTTLPEPAMAILFSFSRGIGLDALGLQQFPKDPTAGWAKLFEGTHVAFARFARSHPQVQCVIKTKWGARWFAEIEDVLKAHQLPMHTIPNLRLTWTDNSHDLMLRSRLVCAFNSMALLESGILDIPVIVPHFAEATDPRYVIGVKAPDADGAFDVARSSNELEALLARRFSDPTVEARALQRRRAEFERWISRLDGQAVPRYLALLRSLARRAQASQQSHAA